MKKFKVFFAFLIAMSVIMISVGHIVESSSYGFYSMSDYNAESSYMGNYKKVSKKDKNVAKSVVLIEIFYDDPFGELRMIGSATAFSVKYDRKSNSTYMITNNHVCDIYENIMYLSYVKADDPIPDYKIHHDRKLEIIAVDEDNDLCLVKAANEKIKPVTFSKSKSLDKMDDLYSIGAPAGIYPIWISGKFSGFVDRDIESFGMDQEGNDFMLISGIVIGGQSGSPVYNDSGHVVGVIFASIGDLYGGLAIPSESVVEFLEENL